MWYFKFSVVVVMFLFWNQCKAVIRTIECPKANALPLNQVLENLTQASYWTKILAYDSNDISAIPPIGFVVGYQLVHTFIVNPPSGSSLGSYSLVTIENNDLAVKLYGVRYDMDAEKAIFESLEPIRVMNFYYNPMSNPQVNTLVKENRISDRIRFALVYIGRNGGFRIYQTCDGKFAWVQIRYHEMVYLVKNKYDPVDPFLYEINKVIPDRIFEKDVKVQINYTVRNQFPFPFDHIKACCHMALN